MKVREGTNFSPLPVVLLGIGLGGFFDGIVLHQLLQWHHMLSSWYPMNTAKNVRLNTVWDGIFHAATYVMVVMGLYLIWRAAQRDSVHWSGKMWVGALFAGWGSFNVIEGLVDHLVLGVHHVNEAIPMDQWFAWDVGFLVWGVVMQAAGVGLYMKGRSDQPVYARSD